MSDEHGRPAGPVPGADEPTRPVQNGVTPDHNRPAGGPPEPGRPGNATPEPNRPAGATPEPGRSAGVTPDHGRSAGVTPPPIPPRPLPPTAPVDGPVSERTTQIIPPRPDAVSEQATDRVETQRREPAAPPRPAEAARPEPPRPEQQRPEPPRAPEQHERPTLSKPEPPTTVQAPPWQRGPAGQVPQREPQSNLHRPGEPPVTGRPPAAPARDSDEAERAARREAAKVKSAVIDGPTRSIARPELAKDMPDLSEVRHPTPSSEPARAHAVPVAAAVPPPAADGAGLRATVQLRRIDPWSTLKVSLVISVALFLIWMVAVGLLYLVLDGMGVWNRLNTSFTETFSESGSEGLINAGQVFGYSAVIGLVNVVLITALTTIGSFIYNQCTDLVGGIQVTLADPD